MMQMKSPVVREETRAALFHYLREAALHAASPLGTDAPNAEMKDGAKK
jgi:hypothetical protein